MVTDLGIGVISVHMANGVRLPRFPCKSPFSGNFHDFSQISGFLPAHRCWVSADFGEKFPKLRAGKFFRSAGYYFSVSGNVL